MPRLPAAVIGDAHRNSIAWETLESLVDVGNRMAGQDGEEAAAEVVAEAFEGAGLQNVTMESFEIPGWWRGATTLSLPDHDQHYGDPHQLFALPGTPAGEVEAAADHAEQDDATAQADEEEDGPEPATFEDGDAAD